MFRKATESRSKAREELFLVCNVAVWGIFGFAHYLARFLQNHHCHYGVKILIILFQNHPVPPECLDLLSELSWAISYKQPTGFNMGLFG